MSLPYLPLFIDDYEAATAHLSLLEDGAYNRLLRLCWRSPGCKIPGDEAWVMRKMRATTKAEIDAIKSVLGEFFTRKDGFWHSPFAAESVHKHRRRAPRPWVPLAIQREVWSRDGRSCAYCGATDGPFHLDHIMPWAMGGGHSAENLTVACAECNWSKGGKTLDEWGWDR